MPDNRTFHVVNPNGQMVSKLGTKYDQAGAEHLAESESRRNTGTYAVVAADSDRVVAEYVNGRKGK